MKLTLGWLKDYLDTNAALDAITDRLTAIGLELEGVEDRAQIYAPFKVARIEKADKHPDADRLKVCVVDTGAEKLQVVCGAPNARAGMKGFFAPAGSVIPGTGITLKKGMIRGQESCGMMVSGREMGLSDDHEGILDVTEADPPLGTTLAAFYGLDDPVIDVGLTPNRADCAGIRGIARDLAAAGLGTLKPLDESPVPGTFASPVSVRIEDTQGCPHFIGRFIRGVKNGPSPDWMQRRLAAIGLRPISALVDITNYMSFALGRPLHVFDADRLAGNVHVRTARAGETLEALDGKTYTLDDSMTAVCDDSGVIGLGGVIGGAGTGCTAETVNVFLEIAYFDPLRIARTGRALQIVSDARYRFERGVDPAFLPAATEIATRLILELCGGAASEPVQAGAALDGRRTIAFDPAFTEKRAGVAIPADTQRAILESLGFEISADGLHVTPPSWRADVEGPADLVEEIVRIYGYNKIEAVSLPRTVRVTTPADTTLSARARKVRTALAARGLQECVTWSFMRADRAAQFGGDPADGALRIVNPISTDLDRMRPTALPNLIEAGGRNRDRGYPGSALFEVGPVFTSSRPDGQKLSAAGIRCGATGPKHWSGPATARDADLFDAKADALAVLAACGAPVATLQTARGAPDWYHPGRSGVLRLGKTVLAAFGDLHPAVRDEMDIRESVCAFEVFLDDIPVPRRKSGAARPLPALSAFQPVARDFAFIVETQTEANTLLRAVVNAEKTLIADAAIFDVYTGPGVEDGHKSVALTVTLIPTDRTLTEADIDAVAQKIVVAVAQKTGGTLRSQAGGK